MKLTIKRYSVMLSLQSVLFIVDFLINILSLVIKQHNGISLILFIIQVVCLVLSIATLFLTFFSTYAFQAGLIGLLYEKFHVSLVIFFFYFVLTILVQLWFLTVEWNKGARFTWSTPHFVLFIFQRTLTPVFYYYYKRASLRISDPRFYEEVWNENHVEKSSTK